VHKCLVRTLLLSSLLLLLLLPLLLLTAIAVVGEKSRLLRCRG
jgi:cell division protein FtsL